MALPIPLRSARPVALPVTTLLPRVALLFRLGGQGLLLVTVYTAGNSLASGFKLPLPGNLIGLVLLLALLASGVVQPAQLQELGRILLTHLPFFFVPLAVGLMTRGTLLATSGAVLVASLIVAAAVGIATAGLVAQTVARYADAADERR